MAGLSVHFFKKFSKSKRSCADPRSACLDQRNHLLDFENILKKVQKVITLEESAIGSCSRPASRETSPIADLPA